MRSFLAFLLFSFVGAASADATEYYYCFDRALKSFSFSAANANDTIISIEKKKRDQIISYAGFSEDELVSCDRFYKAYDEGNRVIVVCKEKNSNTAFKILMVDNLYSGTPYFINGYGYHHSRAEFESIYKKPLTKREVDHLNKNPELLPYLPAAPNLGMTSIAFLRPNARRECELIGYLQSMYRSTVLSAVRMLSKATSRATTQYRKEKKRLKTIILKK